MARASFIALFIVLGSLIGLCVFNAQISPGSVSPHLAGAVCRELFHYGVFDLPLPCRFHMSPVANLETDLALPNTGIYQRVEYLAVEGEGINFRNIGIMDTSNFSTVGFSHKSSAEVTEVSFSNLYPAVIECFAIILCGYAAGRGNLISQTESKGLNIFVGSFSLPALIFISMSKLDFSSVNWVFLSALCVSKTLIFFIVVIITLLVYRPIDFSRAGLYAIFCTQSNDFALGYPIVAALYSKVHPEFASYLYLVAPISLVFLNPIGFILMEIGKRRHGQDASENNNSQNKETTCGLFLNIVKEFILNPFVFMTVLGIVANFIFKHNLPVILEGILKVLGQAFSASALFLLGLSMVGKVQNLRGSGLVAPGILIAVKTLVLPLVTREIIGLFKPGISPNETSDYSNYGFLYGTFPTAPGVFVFASKYDVAVDMIASAMVACTFMSAPLMFISAKMVTLVTINPMEYVQELEVFLFNVSIIGLICSLWVLLIFLLTRKWRKLPHFVTMCLALSQCIACIGALMWSLMECNHTWKLYLQFIFFSFGVFSSRIWTALLAVTLFLLRWRSLCFVLRIRIFLVLFGWGVPSIIVAALVLVVQQETDLGNKHDPNFQYGSVQAIVALLLLWFSLFTTIVCLILHQRFEKRYARYESLLNVEDIEENRPNNIQHTLRTHSPTLSNGTADLTEVTSSSNESLDELLLGGSTVEQLRENQSLFSYDDNISRRERESSLVPRPQASRESPSRSQLTEPEENIIIRDRDDEFQMMRHVVLLLFLSGSMIVGFSLCMWTLISSQINGIYIELVFLDVVLNFGQGVFTAVIFGLDTKLILAPFMKGYRRVVYGAPTVQLPSIDKVDMETKQTCEQFSTYHMDKCIKDIVRDRTWRLKQLSSCFAGKELVDWLMMVGLAHDRTDAVKYGRRLLQGRIIRHSNNLHHFHDMPLFYTFVFPDDASRPTS